MNNVGRKEEKKSSILTKETCGVVLILFATLATICLISGDKIFSVPGKGVQGFLLGVFGYSAFVVQITMIVGGILLFRRKKLNVSKKRAWFFVGTILSLLFLVHSITTRDFSNLTYGEYLATCYNNGFIGLSSSTGGGVILGLLCYLFSSAIKNIGCYVVFSILLVVFSYLFVSNIIKKKIEDNSPVEHKINSSYVKEEKPNFEEKDYPVDLNFGTQKPKQHLFVNNPESFALKTKKDYENEQEDYSIHIDKTTNGLNIMSGHVSGKVATPNDPDIQQKINYIKHTSTINVAETVNNNTPADNVNGEINVSRPVANTRRMTIEDAVKRNQIIESRSQQEQPTENLEDSAVSHAQDYSDKYAGLSEVDSNDIHEVSSNETYRPVEPIEKKEEPINENKNDENVEDNSSRLDIPMIEEPTETTTENPTETPRIVNFDRDRRAIFDNLGESEKKEDTNETEKIDQNDLNEKESENEETNEPLKPSETNITFEDKENEKPSYTSRVEKDGNFSRFTSSFDRTSINREQEDRKPNVEEKQEVEEEKVVTAEELVPIGYEYIRPPFDLLNKNEIKPEENQENHQENMAIIKNTLAEFKINVEPKEYVHGPSITRYEIEMPAGISVKRITQLDNDLKMRLAVKNGIRIEAPIPGKNRVGIEVANKFRTTVGFREVMEDMAKNPPAKPGSLIFAVGRNIVGKAIYDDLAKGPHFLIGGSTGSGKSVALNTMIVSLIMRYSPAELRLILVDPKNVSFTMYEHLPHLLIDEIIVDSKRTITALQWTINEMERRYKVFREANSFVMDIDAYNSRIAVGNVPKMPKIVIIIDELADLMSTCKKDMEEKIQRIAQKSRAAGIHLVLCTQRPSVDVITGTIKSNLPSRMGLKLMNAADSITILGEGGCEKLLGNGDMLYKNSGMSESERYQGCWISDMEISAIAENIKENNPPYFDEELTAFLEKETKPKVEEVQESEGGETKAGIETTDTFIKALDYAISANAVSISSLQRRFQIGYSKAGGIIDAMERLGFISPNEGAKARRVLLTREEFEKRYGQIGED